MALPVEELLVLFQAGWELASYAVGYILIQIALGASQCLISAASAVIPVFLS